MGKHDRRAHNEFESQHNPNLGSIVACKRCSGLVCCGVLRQGGPIEPPYLTQTDVDEIEYYTGLDRKDFTVKKINPHTGNEVYIMQTKTNGGCAFLDSKNGKCRIYSFRPIDCRLFPLDIQYVEGKYYWALFGYNRCSITQDDLKCLLEYREEALELFGDEILDFATIPVPGMEEIGYKLLMEV